ncbi:MAG: anti-sigma factor [Sphingobacteriales bacterium]|nr:anti-sigma factor [Sphingobacteriales bacterium]MBI3720748.1 anti-sigma factor [Sphingobacteriales bacterium]
MNPSDIISSGKLELYVAGSLPETEMREIAAYASQYPEVAREIEQIEQAMVAYYAAGGEVLSNAEADKNLQEIFAKSKSASTPVVPITTQTKSIVVSMSRVAVAAMIGGLFLTTALALLMWSQQNSLRKEIAEIKSSQEQLLAENAKYKEADDAYQKQMQVVQDIFSKRVEVKTVAFNPFTNQPNTLTKEGNFILLYWHPQTKKVLLMSANLPQLSPNEQYQLWGMVNDGKTPVDAGVFEYKDGHLEASWQKDINNAKAFAVSIEPRGGSKSPTIDKVCMVGSL